MQALLFADRPGTALLPLTEHTCTALLPVVGKPLVVFSLEDLASAGIREALLVASPHADLIERELGDGARWGMRLEYVLARPGESPERIVSKVAGQLREQFVMMRGDVLRSPLLREFLNLANGGGGRAGEAIYGGDPAALRLASLEDPETWRLAGGPGRPSVSPAAVARIEVPAGRVSSIASLAEYHRANIDAAAGRFGKLIVPGREVSTGVRIGRQSRVPSAAIKGSPIFVGSRCRIDRAAELMNGVVISDDVIVDRQSTLRSAVILPHTYIGELVDVSDSIASTNYLISAASGSVTRVVDSFLLSGLKRTSYTGGLTGALHRVLGLLVLLLSAPLWPLMFIASMMSRPSRPLRRVRLVGNKLDRSGEVQRRRSFICFEAATSVPALKSLPLLFAVVSGDLRLVGVEAMPPEQEAALHADWERLREEAPVGLIGPVRLTVGPGAPEEEKRVAEGYYARTRTELNDIMLLGAAARTLFKASSWLPSPRGAAYVEQELTGI
jgi:mannose-1-phosphate guanylyltransferase / phosphomannomutase